MWVAARLPVVRRAVYLLPDSIDRGRLIAARVVLALVIRRLLLLVPMPSLAVHLSRQNKNQLLEALAASLGRSAVTENQMTRILAVALLFLALASTCAASVSYVETSYNPALLPLPGALYNQWYTEFIIWSNDPSATGFLVTVQIDRRMIRSEVHVIPGESGAIAIFIGAPQQVRLLGIEELHSIVRAPVR